MTDAAQPPGRLPGAPVAVVDIGSNSIRLVVYEALSRAPTPLFNEKVLCGLGRGVAVTGLLAEDAIERALTALRCFRTMAATMGAAHALVLATAATRDARNGAAFLDRARAAIGADITLIDGAREAELAAKGVLAGLWKPDGLVGDLGGGSLELTDVRGGAIAAGLSLPIGGLALNDLSRGSPRRAVRIVREALAEATGTLDRLRGRSFYAVGGTWRALARLHMKQRRYPLQVMHGYAMGADDPDHFTALVERSEAETPGPLAAVASARRPLLSFGAVVLAEIVRAGRPGIVVVSTSGVREGLLFEQLGEAARGADPLLVAAADFNTLRARDPAHGPELSRWTGALLESSGLPESPDERRLREAACLMADLGWRAHPDYRGAAAVGTVANAALVGVGHQDRAFLAATINHRYEGLDAALGADWHVLLTPALLERARILAGAMRVAFQLSTAMAGVLPRTSLLGKGAGVLTLTLPPALAALASQRLQNRLRLLARLLGREPEMVVAAADEIGPLV